MKIRTNGACKKPHQQGAQFLLRLDDKVNCRSVIEKPGPQDQGDTIAPIPKNFELAAIDLACRASGYKKYDIPYSWPMTPSDTAPLSFYEVTLDMDLLIGSWTLAGCVAGPLILIPPWTLSSK